MIDRSNSTFSRRLRAARPRDKGYEVRDDIVSGLGVSIQPTGTRTFFLARMARGKRRYARIGDADAMTVPEARREARSLIASYIEPARKDNGPRTPGYPMTEFAEEFLDRQARHRKPRTLETNRYLIRNHILPAFGHMTVDAIESDNVRSWFASMAGKPGSANRAMPVLSVMMRMAELWGYRVHNTNPCKRTRRYRMKPKERFLTSEEMARLNAVPTRDEFRCPDVVAIVRLLMLTGCRKWEHSHYAAGAKCSICDGAKSATVRSRWPIPRLARAPCGSARPRRRLSRRCPAPAIRTPSCSRRMPGGTRPPTSSRAGARSATTRSWTNSGCMICATISTA